MKVKYGSIVVAGSGKIGGHVASHNKGGAYFRTKVTPTNPQTTSQSLYRGIFSANSKEWSVLTDVQRQAWNTMESLKSVTGAFGDKMLLSGKALFSKVNNNLQAIGAATIASPVIPVSAYVMAVSSFTFNNGTQIASLTFSNAIPATHTVIVKASPSVSPGISFSKNLTRIIRGLNTGDTSPVALSGEYLGKFGAIGAAGQRVFWEMYAIEKVSGIASAVVRGSSIIAA